jgi:cytochrome c oxidase subunit 4
MSTTESITPAQAPTVGGGSADDDAHHHPGDLLYIQIAIILGAITAVEVLTYFVDFGPFQTPALLIMMVVKFAMVAMFFMHLKFDNKIFTLIFYTGLFLAIFVYASALATFHFFS